MTALQKLCWIILKIFHIKHQKLGRVLENFQKKVGTTYPIALDPGAKHFSKFAHKNSGVTRNIVIDKNGKIAFLTRLFDKIEFQNMIDKIEFLIKGKN